MTDLKPCPVCGSTYLFRGKGVSCSTLRIIRYFRLTFPHGVTCMNCGFHKATIRGWNRRAGEGEEGKHEAD